MYKKIAEDREKEMVARKAAAKAAAPAKTARVALMEEVREARAQSAFEGIHDQKIERGRLKRAQEDEQRAESRRFQKRPKAGAANDRDADVEF
jgi:hypothetical protein